MIGSLQAADMKEAYTSQLGCIGTLPLESEYETNVSVTFFGHHQTRSRLNFSLPNLRASCSSDGGRPVGRLTEAFLNHGKALSEVRREVYQLLVEETWKTAMRSRHYITTQCLDTPSHSAWMVLYKHGNYVNFVNATSLNSSFDDSVPTTTSLITRLAVNRLS
ncbi:uncharacterized protein PITG_19627 [Phytophthora infestans T30-4]|uniref:Uncharacterized protein n=1 Tax=Phytophthora infestans (strain T30-4) TaxID=403677 RepID=D0P0G4_PHYIT|nr:uncharacterized protein PITG_19627 [Phytophthora infestans T30-4]EEY52926.1 hypothetical protein PITG_19627 [Phytophthora infestans T30-4]|eukprot:XP_002896193.1 hypothetical protein PITG_19627 [Phytophthora infestans T30-4]